MSIQDKINNARPTTWLTDGMTDEEVVKIVDDARRPLICNGLIQAVSPGRKERFIEAAKEFSKQVEADEAQWQRNEEEWECEVEHD